MVAKMLKPHIKEETLEFFRTVPKALYPHAYMELQHRGLRQVIRYLLSIIFIAYILMLAIAIPKLINLSNYLDEQFPKFERLDFAVNIQTKEPIVITDKDPWVIIDTKGASANLTYNKLLITEQKIYFRESFNKLIEINYMDYLNILSKKDTIRKLFVLLFYLMIPMIIFLLYLLSLIKYAIMIALISISTYLIARLLKYEIGFREAIISCAYASTIMVMLEIISLPLQISQFLLVIPVYSGISIAVVPLALFLTIYIIAIALISGKFVVFGG